LRTGAWREIVSYGLPFVAFAPIGWLSNLSDRYVLAANLDMAVVGQYVASFGIASRLPGVLAGLLNDLFRPALFEAETRRNQAQAKALFAVWIAALGAVSAGITLVVVLFGDAIASVLLADNYRQGARVVMSWIALGYGLFSIAQVVENRFFSVGATRLLVWTKLAGAVTNTALAFVLIPMLGMVGAAVANAAGQGLQLVACLWAWRRHGINRTHEPHP
jgi:O-antigen/teichoic acid export membrane protein